MDNEKTGFKKILSAIFAVVFILVSFTLKLLINALPNYDHNISTIVVLAFVLGIAIYITILFIKDLKHKKINKNSKKIVKQVSKQKTQISPIPIILIITTVIGISFYWFAYRPSQAKKECSHVEVTIPEINEITEAEEIESRYLNELCKMDMSTNYSAIDNWLIESECDKKYPIKKQREYEPPKKDLRIATEEEYEICLRSKGF